MAAVSVLAGKAANEAFSPGYFRVAAEMRREEDERKVLNLPHLQLYLHLHCQVNTGLR